MNEIIHPELLIENNCYMVSYIYDLVNEETDLCFDAEDLLWLVSVVDDIVTTNVWFNIEIYG